MMRLTFFLSMGLSAAALSGCSQFANLTPGAGTNTVARAATGDAVTSRDIEAPAVFSATEAGLWDGRPSLGGVWVAHPDVTEPERVIIRNQANGKFVVGALFRRERDIPGPRLQVSSDAANELAMLAGAPAELNVTALRKEAAEPDQAALPGPAEVETASLDPIAAAAMAIETAPIGAAPAQAAPVPSQLTRLDKPFIQIGIFSIEANATRSAQLMQNGGMVPTIKPFSTGGKTFHRVVVGPAASASERAALLEQVKTQGFTDAYIVAN